MIYFILGIIIFSFCSAVIFTPHIREGLVAKHCFIFAAISAFIYAMPEHNIKALFYSFLFIIFGFVYYMAKELIPVVKDTWLFHENK